jgi:hypothetical protein
MKKTSSSRRLASLLLAAGVAMATPTGVAFAQQPSAGDVAQARELYNEGLALRDKGDLKGAVEKLRAAHALASTPLTGIELGKAYIATGQLVEAREALLAVASIPVSARETARSTTARTEAVQLAEQVRARIPSLVVKVDGVPVDSVALTIDGAAVPREALSAPRLVNPGSHDLVATSTTGGSATTRIDLKEGEARTVELKIVFSTGAAAPPVVPPTVASTVGATSPDTSAPAQSSSSLRPTLMVGGFGLAAVGTIVGSVTGVMALSKGSSVKNACNGLDCPGSVQGDLSSGRTLGTVSTVSFIAAGVGAAVGVVGLALHPHQEGAPPATARVAPWIAPGGAGFTGELRF